MKRYMGIDDTDDLIESQDTIEPSWERLKASQEYYKGISALEEINYRIYKHRFVGGGRKRCKRY